MLSRMITLRPRSGVGRYRRPGSPGPRHRAKSVSQAGFCAVRRAPKRRATTTPARTPHARRRWAIRPVTPLLGRRRPRSPASPNEELLPDVPPTARRNRPGGAPRPTAPSEQEIPTKTRTWTVLRASPSGGGRSPRPEDADDRATHRPRRRSIRSSRPRRPGSWVYSQILEPLITVNQEMEIVGAAGDVLGVRRSHPVALHAPPGRDLPRRHAVQRGRGEVHLGPRDQQRPARPLEVARRRRRGPRSSTSTPSTSWPASRTARSCSTLPCPTPASSARPPSRPWAATTFSRAPVGTGPFKFVEWRAERPHHARGQRRLLARPPGPRPGDLPDRARRGRAHAVAADRRGRHGAAAQRRRSARARGRPRLHGRGRARRRHLLPGLQPRARRRRRRARAPGDRPRHRPRAHRRGHPRGRRRAGQVGHRRAGLRLQGHGAPRALPLRPRAGPRAARRGRVHRGRRRLHARRGRQRPHAAGAARRTAARSRIARSPRPSRSSCARWGSMSNSTCSSGRPPSSSCAARRSTTT